MDEDTIRNIAETAFRRHFDGIEIVRINVRRGLGCDDEPIVSIRIIYEGDVEQLSGDKLLLVLDDMHAKLDDDDIQRFGWPLVDFISKSDIGRRDPATI